MLQSGCVGRAQPFSAEKSTGNSHRRPSRYAIAAKNYDTVLIEGEPAGERRQKGVPGSMFQLQCFRSFGTLNIELLNLELCSPWSSHLGDAVWTDLVDHPHFSGLAKRILIFSQVLFGQRIDMRVSALLGDVHDLALDGQVAIGIIGIGDGERYLLAAPHVL